MSWQTSVTWSGSPPCARRSTWCGTGRDADDELEKYDANKGRVRLLLRDPLFGVGVEGGDTVVKVALGYLEVSRVAGAGAVVVGAGQQVHVPDRGEPQAVEPISLSQTDVARFDELRSAVPKPSFDRPAPNGSKTLSTLFERRVLTVGIDQRAVADRGTGVFIRRLFGFLALSWQMKVRFVDLLSVGVSAALDSGSVDIALTPDPSLPAELDFFATFADSTGTVWRTALRHDDVFALALLRFVRAAVGSGDYATFYRGSFGAEPQYEALAKTLLG